MQLKCGFHNHSSEDPEDKLPYSAFDLLDKAKKRHFDVLTITHHNSFFFTKEIQEYARTKNILLIPGIEIDIQNRHVVILNANQDCEKIRSFTDLRKWKKENPNSFIIAPHPFFPFLPPQSLGKLLEKNIDCFDGVELSFFYTKLFDFNRRGRKTALRNNLPIIATSDCHVLDYLDIGFCKVDAKEKTARAVFQALKNRQFKNHSRPASLLQLALIYGRMLRNK